MATTQEVNQVSLKLVVNKKKDKVLFAEAGKDFVDVLFSFLTLPLGTIVRLAGRESNMQPVKVGCLSSLYDGVANLDKEYLSTETCKEMLLQPRNPMEAYCRKMKLNIDDTEPTKYFLCSRPCYNLSAFKNLRCTTCRNLITTEASAGNPNIKHGFVVETATFIICDDLYVMPNVLGNGLAILQNLGIEDTDDILEQTVNVGEKEVLDLLKCSLLSKTPLTDIFLKKKQFIDNFNPRNQSQVEVRDVQSDASRKMVVKALVRKSNGKILLVQGEEDFADFIFSFLTFPLGGVLSMLEGCSSLSCVDQLYKSLAGLTADRYFISPALKENLSEPKCAHQFKLNNQILRIGEACSSFSGCYYNKFVNPKSSTGETSSPEGFAKGLSMYMVTDDLVVTQLSSSSGFCYLNRLKVPLSDLEERVTNIGLKEALTILKASLVSTYALTNGLNHIIETVKKEK